MAGRFRRFMQALANGRQVVRYDRLGSGMSDRERPRETLSLDFEEGGVAANALRLFVELAA